MRNEIVFALPAPVDIVERLDDVLARLHLVARRYGIFKIEKDIISVTVGRFFEHCRIGARHCQFAAL